MKQIGKVYQIPYSSTKTDLTVRRELVDELRKWDFTVNVDENFIGYVGATEDNADAKILTTEVITRNPGLEQFLEDIYK